MNLNTKIIKGIAKFEFYRKRDEKKCIPTFNFFIKLC